MGAPATPGDVGRGCGRGPGERGERGDGAVVTVVVHDDAEAFDTTPEEEHALRAAIAQADRGQVISWERLREQLRRSA